MCRCVVEFGCGVAMFTNSCTRRLTYILLVNTPLHTHTHTPTYTKINNKNNKQSDEHTRGPAIRSRRCSELGIETGEATTPTRGHRSYGTCTAHARAHPYVCTQFSVACARKRYIYIYIYIPATATRARRSIRNPSRLQREFEAKPTKEFAYRQSQKARGFEKHVAVALRAQVRVRSS